MVTSKYSIQTHTQLPAKTWKLTFKSEGMSSGLITHESGFPACTMPNTQTPNLYPR